MSVSRATRTLVKSAPELWAEVSDPAALARHLEEFGEIRITRIEPERTVAWEGERASGTVELETSGWGTKVRLTARLAGDVDSQVVAAPPALAAPEPAYVIVAQEPTPMLAEPAAESGHEAAEKMAPEAPPAARARPMRGFFARMFLRRSAAAAASPQPTPVVPEAPRAPRPAEGESTLAAEQVPPGGATTAPSRMEPTPLAIGPIRVLELPPGAATDPAAQLESVLDVLGTAHRRPFSRG